MCRRELKNTIAVVRDGQAILSQHLGDLRHPLGLAQFKHTIEDLVTLLGGEPQWIAHDRHPGYLSTAYAKALADRWSVPLIGMQHHHAHAAGVLAEYDRCGPALAVVCDGVGYGTDGTAWGGELLVADLVGFKRLARLKPLWLAGGDAAARDTRRCGLALMHQALGHGFERHPISHRLVPDAQERQLLAAMIGRGFGCVVSSSAGRVFDAVAALMGLSYENQFEAQSAIALEAEASVTGDVDHALAGRLFTIGNDDTIAEMRQIDVLPFVRWLMSDDRLAGTARQVTAALFHEVLAAAWEAAVVEASRHTGITTVVLSGGVFCNQRLTRRLTERLARHGFDVLRHGEVPPNDGGLSYGQAAIASARVAGGLSRPRRTIRSHRKTTTVGPSQPVSQESASCV